MKRTIILIILVSLWFLSAPESALRPNVLLISIDTLRADHLGCYGYKTPTPAIDALAAKSVLFENAISQVPLTLPSHCSILTGLYPEQHGVRNNESFALATKFLTLAEIFRENGYATGAVVGSFSLDSTFGVNQGFGFYEDEIGQGHDPEINRQVERRAETVWKLSRKWLEEQKGPWLCFLHFFDPHTGYTPPSPFPQTYDGEIGYVDKVVGQMQQFLQQRNLLSTTILVILSDHGESLGEHGELSHGVFLYDATLRVPLLVAAPGYTANRVPSQVRLVDVAPTILELAGLTAKQVFSGQSLVPFMKGLRKELPAYSESYYTNLLMGWASLYSLRWQNKKWIEAPKQEFYDLVRDPHEVKNLYTSSAVPREFRAEILKHRGATSRTPLPTREVDSETKEKLASLGYVTGSGTTPVSSAFDPKDGIEVWAKIEAAVTYAQTGNLVKSKALFLEALRQQPDNVIAHKFLAAVLREKGEDREAIAHLKIALSSQLHRNDTRYELAKIYYEKGEFQEGLSTLSLVLHEEPENAKALKLAAYHAIEAKKYEEALRYLNRLVELTPTDPDALSQQARMLSYWKKDQEALKAYEKLATLRQLKEDEAIQVAAIYLTTQNVPAAEKYFRFALKANPESVQASKGLGLILANRGQWLEALRAFLKAGDCAAAKQVMQYLENLPSNQQEEFQQKCE